MSDPQILGVIPARYASSRFPGKPLAHIAGKPMIQRVLEQARRANKLAGVVVATDDERIAGVVEAANGKALMTPATLPNGTARVAEAVRAYPGYTHYVNIQGDEAFLAPAALDNLCGLFEQAHPPRIATLVRREADPEAFQNPDVVKAVMDHAGRVLYFSRAPIPYPGSEASRAADQPPRFWQHIGLYGFEAETLQVISTLEAGELDRSENLEQLRWLEAGYRIQAAETSFVSHGIDRPEDIPRALRAQGWAES